MTRLDLFSEIGKQYFIYSTDINEIAFLSKTISTIYTFQLQENVFFGFFNELSLEMLLKIKETTKLVLSSGKDAHDKTVTIFDKGTSMTISLEKLFSPSLSIKSSNEKLDKKLDIQVDFSKTDGVKHQCILVPTESLIQNALNLKHYQFNSIVHCPLKFNDKEYSFIKYYSFLFDMEDAINLSKQHDYYIDVNYKANQKIFFHKQDATYIVLPSFNSIIRFNESPRFLQDMIKIRKENTIKIKGIPGSSYFNEVCKFTEEMEVRKHVENSTKEVIHENNQTKQKEAPSKEVTKKKKKEVVKAIHSELIQENKDDEIISIFASGGIVNKSKIETLIEYAISTKNHNLFVWACVRYIIFYPKYAKQKEEHMSENYKLVFGRTSFNMPFNQRMLEYNSNIFTRFIIKSRKSLINKDVLKFTKDKEGFMSSISENKFKESDFPKEIIASLYSGEKTVSSKDDNIEAVVGKIKSKIKKLSNIASVVDHFADYARYLNGNDTVNKNIDIKSTIFKNDSVSYTETAYAHGIILLLNCARQTGFGFSYTQNFELNTKVEESVNRIIPDANLRVLMNIIRQYYSSDFSSWFKTVRRMSVESAVNDQSFMDALNSTNQFSIGNMIPSIIKKIEDQSFVFKKTSLIEVTLDKILSSNAKIAAILFSEYLSKNTDINSSSGDLLKFIKKAALVILSEVFELNFCENEKNSGDFISLLMASVKSNSDSVKHYFVYMSKISRYISNEKKMRLYRDFTKRLMAYLIVANENKDKINVIGCLADCVSGFISCNSSEESISVLSDILGNINNEQKAILLNKLAKKAYAANKTFKDYFINECINLICEIEKTKNSDKEIIAYYSVLESIFSIYIKDLSEEESRRDIFLAKEEDAYRKRINEIEYFVNSDKFVESEFNETTIQEIL